MVLDWVVSSLARRAERKRALAETVAPAPAEAPLSYEQARAVAASGDAEARKALAERRDIAPEFLYYFANDASPDVRRAIANNAATPLQADRILARDADDSVRGDLAHKIGRLMPTLSEEENQRVAGMVFEVLETLSKDQAGSVRAILAEEVKELDNVPRHVANALARDVDVLVSGPMLRYSPVLTDEDLVEIVNAGLNSDGLVAIAERRNLGESVSSAVANTNDGRAVTALLENRSARIAEAALGRIADTARDRPEWHEALARRENLSDAMVKRIGAVVGQKLIDTLIERNGIRGPAADSLRAHVRDRMGAAMPPPPPDPATAAKRARAMYERQQIQEATILEAIRRGDKSFARHALALKAGVPLERVEGMLADKDPKRVAALSWKADLSSDGAVVVQRDLAEIPSTALLLPRADGGYALRSDELVRYLYTSG
jgi:uncharacterized protein (DUF2336 family)